MDRSGEEPRRGKREEGSVVRPTFIGELEAVVGDLEQLVLGVVHVPAARQRRQLLAYGRHGCASVMPFIPATASGRTASPFKMPLRINPLADSIPSIPIVAPSALPQSALPSPAFPQPFLARKTHSKTADLHLTGLNVH